MPCMTMCCFYLSTRLGSIIIGVLTIVLIPAIILASGGGADSIKNVANGVLDHIDDYAQQDVFMWLLNHMKSDPDQIYLVIAVFLGVHLVCCVLMIVGAIRIQNIFLAPFIAVEFIRLCILTLTHVVAMMVIKKDVNLGDLIALTISGGFGLLLLFYLWACVVALFQIIGIVKTEKYRSLFGDDLTAAQVLTHSNTMDGGKVPIVNSSEKGSENYYTYNSNFKNEYSAVHSRYDYIN